MLLIYAFILQTNELPVLFLGEEEIQKGSVFISPMSADFRSTSVVWSASAHQNRIWMAILNVVLLKKPLRTQNIEQYIQF